ncbi:hypothetical protein SAY86_000518 [Trapa natans]|uniref:Sister chromatid cohesion 1 protein 4-like n=1 Tax=Trapa natans TaxID=22666 RepID=A0AAN7MUI2_TRANT|nr:hypothetical protein SAY86_000518 [Trapa natans]
MFYSQFILAKKGPLGTIWIAAHLERKLRKNQVADTDISLSVDSIIFPDAPIALRLSSHLLLGVVRIYSRKVGYLFDDCSDALLKIKQAFRSSVVDLPPEESTAPYHSITLPETFDLDDFELPDSENFQGNYVDHHVSAKEQITLQDTMDGVVYSTSQFGLDERFGDGDTSQIGLDLNEIDILDIKPESSEYVNDPSIPSIVEEANMPSVHGAHVSGDIQGSEAHKHGDMKVKEAKKSGYSEQAESCLDHVSDNGSLSSPSREEVLDGAVDSIDGTTMCINGQIETQGTKELELKSEENVVPSCSPVHLELDKQSLAVGDGLVDKADSPKMSIEDAVCQSGPHQLPDYADGLEVYDELKDHETSSDLKRDAQSNFMEGLQPCDSNISHQDISLHEGDKQSPTDDVIEVAVIENQTIEPASNEKVPAGFGELLDQFYNETLKIQSGNEKNCVNFGLPAPEKLLSVSNLNVNKPGNLPVELTPNKEDLEQGIKTISGRNRGLIESVGTMQINSLESISLSQSKKTVESIPGDDDLLSSILVGRRSSILKRKCTPAPPEVISSKHPRTDQRTSALKRKVLMDETMVLLGDMIKQQLMNTDDLRRVRKKAPCTLSEISMIQRRFLEDEIFSEPTLAGLSRELFYMRRESYEASRTEVFKLVKDDPPDKAAEESPVQYDAAERSEMGVSNLEVHVAETLRQDEEHQDEESAADSIALVDTIKDDGLRVLGADAVSQSVVPELDMEDYNNLNCEERCDGPDNLASGDILTEKTDDDGASHISHLHTFNEQNLGKDSTQVNVFREEVDAVSELYRDDLVVEVGSHSGHGPSVDAETNFLVEDCILPKDKDISTGIALTAAEEHDSFMLVENSEYAEIIKNMDAVCEADLGSSSVLKDDLGHYVKHEGNTDYTCHIEDEFACFHKDLGLKSREMETTDGHDDFENMAMGNDTGFLNVDDDEVDEDNEHLSDAKDSRLLDNSGWSSRTRAVAKFLQALFDKEAVRGKPVLPMDNLLSGKTRKEASRMFFESLVLKSRDYIQVEQANPFSSINMRPGAKLMKSHFG